MTKFTSHVSVSVFVIFTACLLLPGCGLFPKSTAKLEKMLHSDDPYVCQEAILTLGRKQRIQYAQEFIKLLRDDGRAMVRAAAATALGEFGSTDAVPALVEVVTDTKARSMVRWDAALALGKIGSPAAVKGLAEAARYAADPYVRAAAVAALGRIGSGPAIEALIAALRDRDTNVAHAAARALHEATGEPFDTRYEHWRRYWDKTKERRGKPADAAQ